MSILTSPLTALPLAPLLVLPFLSSWSTSLNLLFFSLTWTTIAATYSPLQLEAFGPFVVRVLLYLLPSALFLLFDLGVPSLAAQVKSQGEHALPVRAAGGKKKVWRIVGWSVFNVALGLALQAGLEWLVTDVLHFRSLLKIKGSKWSLNHLPNPWSMVQHAVLGLVARNVLQYYIHLYLLHSADGGILSTWHETWQHSVRIPFSFVAAYDHPVCYLLHRFLPLYLPAIAFRFHILTYIFLVAAFSLEELFIYSGYSVLPSTIMLRGMARRTEAHFMSGAEGNFGPLGVLDWVHGTTLGKDVMDDLKAEMDKHDVQERAGKAIDDAGDAANGVAAKMKRRARKRRG
ncbi:uncharacterized protein EI97DRAFT_431255 [Westerdykella ornata]|uniref:Fatty acid hydroxylase domain-containing protein n=1 Tax=Westerdykella ornata TaxID=318751 RepID=A0A6A6JTG1_WESOR|nr:uncharacterized protein EI97DRAFT_431255 [Westerdykella ornata]KAF2279036.1 hypothetical protein EI97DRAFT_431255 [Westerdykella ornata]